MKPSIALRIMKSVLKGGNVPFLLGGTGLGKSSLVKDDLVSDLAKGKKVMVDCINPIAKKQYGLIDFRLSLYESVDLGGIPVPIEKDDNWVQKKAFLGNLPISGEGLLLFDEYAQSHPSVQAIVGQLIYEKRLGEYVLPKNWKIVCCANRASDRAGSNKLPSHVIGRVSLIDFECDTNDWLAWAVKNGVHPYVIGWIQYQPEWLNVFDPKIMKPQPSPRAWTFLSDTLKTDPRKEDWQTLAETFIGETGAIEFMSFVNLKDEVPDLDDIVNGREVDIPKRTCKKSKKLKPDTGLMYATIVALVTVIREADPKVLGGYFENSVAYVRRFKTPEFGIFFVRSVIGARAELVDTSTYADFKVENQDLEV